MRYNEVYFSQQSELGDSPDSSSVYPRPQPKVGSNSQRVQTGLTIIGLVWYSTKYYDVVKWKVKHWNLI